MKTESSKILNAENSHIDKFQNIVQKTIIEEKLIIENLLHQPKEILSVGDSLSDKVAAFGGSWKFIISFSCILSIWILCNTLSPKAGRFDPYPFILMNLVLSAIAALQAPIIMMSQNRKEEKDRKQNENDYLINLKAELELRSLHQKINLLMEEQIKVLFDSQANQLEMLEKINVAVEKNTRYK
jgi:uncharacterized membrane protein